MQDTERSDQIKQQIYCTMKRVGLELELFEINSGVNMTYDFIKHTIGIDIDRVQEARKELEDAPVLEEYIRILTLHELGHALDREALLDSLERTIGFYHMKKRYSLKEQYCNAALLDKLLEEHEMNIAFEEKAWANAKILNTQFGIADGESFDKVKAQSMASYIRLYERDLFLREKLSSSQTSNSA